MIERSKNQYSSNIIALSKFDKALDKALDKAFIKHVIKQGESTSESIDSIDKQLTINKEQETINIPFDSFWNLYNRKVGDKKKIEAKWKKLKDFERQKIIDTLPAFLANIKDKQYQPYPDTYLNNKRWEDEIVNTAAQSRHDFLINFRPT
jgi:predicted metal-dependent hydrolase